MNPKILKLRAERDKIRDKLAELQERGKEVNKQLRELENTEVIGMFREGGFSLEQLAELMKGAEGPLAGTPPDTEEGSDPTTGRTRRRYSRKADAETESDEAEGINEGD